jgi:hypothetical protein
MLWLSTARSLHRNYKNRWQFMRRRLRCGGLAPTLRRSLPYPVRAFTNVRRPEQTDYSCCASAMTSGGSPPSSPRLSLACACPRVQDRPSADAASAAVSAAARPVGNAGAYAAEASSKDARRKWAAVAAGFPDTDTSAAGGGTFAPAVAVPATPKTPAATATAAWTTGVAGDEKQ